MSSEQARTDIEAVRKRPGMYIGDISGGGGLNQLVWELLANSLDQHLAGRCGHIHVVLEQDGSVVVDDDGPGIPVTELDGRTFAEVALTRFHATPTFDGHAPHEHVGRYGVGLFVVNALSSHLNLDIFQDGFHLTQQFAQGVALNTLQRVGPTTRTGTRISLRPDQTIFADPWFNAGTIATRLRELAWLLPTLTLTFQDRREHVFHEPRGLQVFLERTGRGSAAIGGMLVIDQIIHDIRVECAIEWLPSRWSIVESYANVERTTDGGTHVQGLIDGLVAGFRDVAPKWKKRSKKDATEAVKRGLHAIVCVRLQDPTYGAPTRSRLVTPAAQNAVALAVRGAFAKFVQGNEALIAHIGDSH